jgi:hypothetical protein
MLGDKFELGQKKSCKTRRGDDPKILISKAD